MNRIIELTGAAAFLAALGIVGAVEQGADVARMVWTVPLIAVMFFAARRSEQRKKAAHTVLKNKNRRYI